METFKSTVWGTEFPRSEIILGKTIRESIFKIIKTEHPKFTKISVLSISELNHYHQKYLETYLISEAGELSQLELDVLNSLESQVLITAEVITEKEEGSNTYVQLSADRVAEVDHPVLCHYFYLDYRKYCFAGQRGFWPLSLYRAKSHSFVPCRLSGTRYYDEPESAGRKGQGTCQAELYG